MDALSSFSSLAKVLPDWISKLHDLSRQVSERRVDFLRLTRSKLGTLSKMNSASIESLRTRARGSPATPGTQTPTTRLEVDRGSKNIFHFLRDGKRRKRKSDSISSTQSGTPWMRSRMSLVIYYDSAIQDQFQWFVRHVSEARNNLGQVCNRKGYSWLNMCRKSQTAARFKARLSSLRMEESLLRGDGDISPCNPKSSHLANKHSSFMDLDDCSLEVFAAADAKLAAAQNLCEAGAHQFLRDGDCSDELSSIKACFEHLLKLARDQIATLSPHRQSEHEANSSANLVVFDPSDDTILNIDSFYMRNDSSLGNHFATALEVDDDDDAEELRLDLSAFRSPRRRAEDSSPETTSKSTPTSPVSPQEVALEGVFPAQHLPHLIDVLPVVVSGAPELPLGT